MGIISDFFSAEKCTPVQAGIKRTQKYLFIDMEKLKNPSENYNGRDFIKYNINNLDEDRLKLIGFTKRK